MESSLTAKSPANEMPSAVDSEEIVLGAYMNEDPNIADVSLDESAFYDPKHKMIYRAIGIVRERGEACDIVSVTQELRRIGKLDMIGGGVRIAEIWETIASAKDLRRHAKAVKDAWLLRRLITSCRDGMTAAMQRDKEADQIVADHERAIYDLTMNAANKTVYHISEILPQVMQEIEDWQTGEMQKRVIDTGFVDFDKLIVGFMPGDLVILAGQTSHGKSQAALQIARHVAGKGKAVLILSLEMSRQSLVTRALATEARLDSMQIKRGKIGDDGWGKLTVASTKLADKGLYFVDDSYVSVSALRSICRQMKNRSGLDLIVVDYLQLMQTEGKSETREREVAAVSRGLKALAKDICCPVMALSQFSRKVDNRADKRPTLSDLRESGSLEQDADMVLFVYHDKDAGTSELIAEKYRSGARGKVPMTFKDGRWENYAPEPSQF